MGNMLCKIFGQPWIVLCNIVCGEGGNDLVEQNHGVKCSKVGIESIMNEIGSKFQGSIEFKLYSSYVYSSRLYHSEIKSYTAVCVTVEWIATQEGIVYMYIILYSFKKTVVSAFSS